MQRKNIFGYFLDINLTFVTVWTSWHLLSKKRWMSTKKSEKSRAEHQRDPAEH